MEGFSEENVMAGTDILLPAPSSPVSLHGGYEPSSQVFLAAKQLLLNTSRHVKAAAVTANKNILTFMVQPPLHQKF
jgi:hypothetical protein